MKGLVFENQQIIPIIKLLIMKFINLVLLADNNAIFHHNPVVMTLKMLQFLSGRF
jgi:hypothetical protein